MTITINGGVQFSGGFSSLDSPTLSMNDEVIEIKDGAGVTTAYNFTEVVSFTRASSATYFGSDGLMQTTPISKNLLTYTEEINQSPWSSVGTVSANTGYLAPNGLLTATQLVLGAGTNTWRSQNITTISLDIGESVTFSAWVRADTTTNISFFLSGSSPIFNGYIGNAFDVGTSWVRYQQTYTASQAVTISGVGFRQTSASSSATIYVWGAQFERGSSMTSYTRNYGGVYPPRFEYDPITLKPKGLLIEEQRTNVVTYSEQLDNAIWTKNGSSIQINQTIAPDGTSNADAIYETSISSWHGVSQPYTGTSGQTYTLTAFMKKGNRNYGCLSFAFNNLNGCYVQVDLTNGTLYNFAAGTGFSITTSSATNVGNGWWRVTLTGTYGAGNTVYPCVAVTGDTLWTSGGLYNNMYVGDPSKFMYAWGIQLELGAFATSYIPTTSSSVTRSADIATITGSTFSLWYNQSEGSALMRVIPNFADTGSAYTILSFSNTSVNYIESGWTTAGTRTGWPLSRLRNSGLVTTEIGSNLFVSGTAVSSAVAYSSAELVVGAAGTPAVAVSNTSTMPTPFELKIGPAFNGTIKTIQYYPFRVTNSQIQQLTI